MGIDFFQRCFCVHWNDHMVSILQFLIMWVPHWLTDWCMLKNPCFPGINPSWSWCMMLLMCCWIQFACILLMISASVFVSGIGLEVSFLWYVCLVLVSEWWWPHRMSLKVFLPLQFFGGSFRRIGVNSSLNRMFDRIRLWSLLVPVSCLLGVF